MCKSKGLECFTQSHIISNKYSSLQMDPKIDALSLKGEQSLLQFLVYATSITQQGRLWFTMVDGASEEA